MSAYILARIRVTDAAKWEQYRAAVPAVVAHHGGRYIVRGGEPVALEGSHEGRRLVVLEFPTVEAARAFWASPDYAAVKKLRAGAGEVEAVLVPGV